MSNTQLVLVAYGGNPHLVPQATYAVLSALAYKEDAAVEISIYTDAPEHFSWLTGHLRIEQLTRERMAGLAPGAAGPYYLKLAAIQETASRFPGDAVLFCDADTYFVTPFAPLLALIASGRRMMHRREYDVAAHPTNQMRKFRHVLRRAGLREGTNGLFMWNSGVIGLPLGSAGVLDEALSILNRLVPHTPKKFLAEQFSISLAMQAGASVVSAEEYVFHYWYQKPDYTRAIRERLQAWHNWPLEKQLSALREQPLVLPAPPQKLHWWEIALIGAGLRDRPADIRGLHPSTVVRKNK